VDRREQFDVIVVGGGNAALSAALAARHIVPRVLVLERAPEHMRGGNSRHTRNVRCAHPAADEFFSAPYSEEELLEDLIGVTGGPANLDLAKFAIRQSSLLPQWMSKHGASWQQPLAGTLSLGRTNRWFLGGGKALLNAYYRTAHAMGIRVRYNAFVEDLVIENDHLEAVAVKTIGGPSEVIHARAAVVAAGGYEANIGWLKRHWGDAADNFIIRGTPYNDGAMLATLLGKGAMPMGDPKGFHAIAVDARAPKFDGGIVTRLDAIPFGVVVNKLGRRFYDEGEAIWPKRYAIWGGLIAAQPDQIAFAIVDSKTINRFLPPMFKPHQADSLRALAAVMNVEENAFVDTLNEYNRATLGKVEQQLEAPDGNSTRGISPPKSNWAIPIDQSPFYALPLRPGITFTYMGVAVDETGRVLDCSGHPFQNVYAAGEIMSGNILTKGYLAGFGMTIGSVFGELAGRMAATNVCG
jgi:tricarballylate dehydrogenase